MVLVLEAAYSSYLPHFDCLTELISIHILLQDLIMFFHGQIESLVIEKNTSPTDLLLNADPDGDLRKGMGRMQTHIQSVEGFSCLGHLRKLRSNPILLIITYRRVQRNL